MAGGNFAGLANSRLRDPARARSLHLIACSPLFDGLGKRERPASIQDLFPRLIQPYDVIPSRYDRQEVGLLGVTPKWMVMLPSSFFFAVMLLKE